MDNEGMGVKLFSYDAGRKKDKKSALIDKAPLLMGKSWLKFRFALLLGYGHFIALFGNAKYSDPDPFLGRHLVAHPFIFL